MGYFITSISSFKLVLQSFFKHDRDIGTLPQSDWPQQDLAAWTEYVFHQTYMYVPRAIKSLIMRLGWEYELGSCRLYTMHSWLESSMRFMLNFFPSLFYKLSSVHHDIINRKWFHSTKWNSLQLSAWVLCAPFPLPFLLSVCTSVIQHVYTYMCKG